MVAKAVRALFARICRFASVLTIVDCFLAFSKQLQMTAIRRANKKSQHLQPQCCATFDGEPARLYFQFYYTNCRTQTQMHILIDLLDLARMLLDDVSFVKEGDEEVKIREIHERTASGCESQQAAPQPQLTRSLANSKTRRNFLARQRCNWAITTRNQIAALTF